MTAQEERRVAMKTKERALLAGGAVSDVNAPFSCFELELSIQKFFRLFL